MLYVYSKGALRLLRAILKHNWLTGQSSMSSRETALATSVARRPSCASSHCGARAFLSDDKRRSDISLCPLVGYKAFMQRQCLR